MYHAIIFQIPGTILWVFRLGILNRAVRISKNCSTPLTLTALIGSLYDFERAAWNQGHSIFCPTPAWRNYLHMLWVRSKNLRQCSISTWVLPLVAVLEYLIEHMCMRQLFDAKQAD